MRFIIIVLTFFFNLNPAFSIEANSENELVFLNSSSKYIDDNKKNKGLRTLREFKVGKKYCLWGTKNWDETCQDAAMKYAFGADWREFKRVTLEFIELVQKNDIKEFAKLFTYPFELYDITPTRDYLATINNVTDLEDSDDDFLPRLMVKLKGTTYKNFLICNNLYKTSYNLYLSKNLFIEFEANYEDNSELEPEEQPAPTYSPKISSINQDFCRYKSKLGVPSH